MKFEPQFIHFLFLGHQIVEDVHDLKLNDILPLLTFLTILMVPIFGKPLNHLFVVAPPSILL